MEVKVHEAKEHFARLIPIAPSRVAAQGMDQGVSGSQKILTLLMLLLKRFLKERLRKGPLVPRDDPSKSPVDTQQVKRVLDHEL
jgi:hypothetical protein